MKGTFIQKQVVCGLYILYKITKNKFNDIYQKMPVFGHNILDLYQNKQLSY